MPRTQFSIDERGLRAFKQAIQRNPQLVYARGRVFLNRGLMVYRRQIEGHPWQVNQSGGGVPVDTGDLRQSHTYKVDGLTGRVQFSQNPNRNRSRSPYGVYVHEGTVKMRKRPWLDYAVVQGDTEIQKHYKDFLKEIVKDLAK